MKVKAVWRRQVTCMWKDPLINFYFLILCVTVLALRHPGYTPGLIAHGGDAAESYPSGDDISRQFPNQTALRRAAEFIDQAWRRTVVFKEWWMEYNASRWEMLNASSPAESDLLEARFHVANAEVFTEAMNEHDRAIKELARAETSIEAAERVVAPRIASQLTNVRKEVVAAETSNADTEPFDLIKSDLDRLIERLRISHT